MFLQGRLDDTKTDPQDISLGSAQCISWRPFIMSSNLQSVQ